MPDFNIKWGHFDFNMCENKFRSTYIEFYMGDSKFRMGQNGKF